LKEITDAVASYHHVTAIAIRYFGVSGGQRKKFKSSQGLLRQCMLIELLFSLFCADFG